LDQAAVYIILLNWNSAADTLRCLRALTLLRGVQARVMVVDNGSEPADLERLRSGIARWGLAVELVETGENRGLWRRLQCWIRLALERGAEFVWLLNNDAVPHPDALQAMLRVMEGDAQVAAVGSVIYDLERPKRVQTWGGGRVWRWAGVARHHRRPVAARRLDYLTAASILLRRAALERAGLFDEDTFFHVLGGCGFVLSPARAGLEAGGGRGCGDLASALVQPRARQSPQGLLCHRLLPPVFAALRPLAALGDGSGRVGAHCAAPAPGPVAQCAGDRFRAVGQALRPVVAHRRGRSPPG
jgi:Predicted glycosyltransferases